MSSSPPLVVADRYRLVAPLGQGGMGRVWRATDVVLHRDVAIKELVPPPGLTTDERREMRERSLREARAIARLNNINVVRVFDVLRTDADPWIVMEYVPSRSLQDTLASDGPFPPVRAAEIGLGVLGALRAAHRAGVVHRDVKPGNVLIGEDGRVVLTDFGLATVPGDPNVTRTGLVLGSPAYIAPERARDGTAGPAADLWSLGATLYAAVEGASPFARPSAIATLAALATENPPPARNAGPLKAVLNGLLRKDPAHRINADEAERLLTRAAGRGRSKLFPMSPTTRRPGIGRERPALPGRTPVVPGPASAAGSAPVVPGPSSPAGPPVVPGPRPPVSPAADGRPIFAPGKASVGSRPAETPTRVDGPPVEALDATRLDAPPINDKPIIGTGTASSGAGSQEAAASAPASGATMRGSRSAAGAFTADEVAAHRKRPATARASAAVETPAAPPQEAPPQEAPPRTPDQRTATAPDQRTQSAPEQRTVSAPEQRTVTAPDERTESSPDQRPSTAPSQRTDTAPDQRTESAPNQRIDTAADQSAESAPDQRTSTPPTDSAADADADAGKVITVPAARPAAPVTPTAPVDGSSQAAESFKDPATQPADEPQTGPAELDASAATPEAVDGEPKSAAAEPADLATKTAETAAPETAEAAAPKPSETATAEAPPATGAAAEAATPAAAATETAAQAAADTESARTESAAPESDAADPVAVPEATSPEIEATEARQPEAPEVEPAQPVDSAELEPITVAGADQAEPDGETQPESKTTSSPPAEASTEAPAESAAAAIPEQAARDTATRRAKPSTGARSAPTGPKPSRKKGRGRPFVAGAAAATKAAPKPATPEAATSVEEATSAGRATERVKPQTGAKPQSVKALAASGKGEAGAAKSNPTKVDVRATTAPARPAWQPMPVGDGGSRGITIFGTTLTRRQLVIAAAILLAIVLALVLLIPRAFGSDPEDNKGSKGGAAPAASATGKPSASAAAPANPPTAEPTTAAPTSAAPSPSTPATVKLPAGWHLYSDRTGFKVPVPENWNVRRDGSEVYFEERSGARRILIVDQTRTPALDPVKDWKNLEAVRKSNYRDYHKIKIESVKYWDKAADWEWTYTSGSGTPMHESKRGFITRKDQAYGITWVTTAKNWNSDKADLQRIYDGFVPARK